MMMLTGVQLRSARALLAWSETELSTATGLPERTIVGLELRDGPLDADPEASSRIHAAFEAAGLEFTDGDEHGVRLGPAWYLHRVADSAAIDDDADGHATVVRDPEGLTCVSRAGRLLGTVRGSSLGVVTDPDIGHRPTAERITASDLKAWVRAALGRMSGGRSRVSAP